MLTAYHYQKYALSTLYPTSSGALSIDYPSEPQSVTVVTIPRSSQMVIQEFNSAYGNVLFPDIWRVKVDVYASGNQSTTKAKLGVEFLINGVSIATSPFVSIPYTGEPGSLWYDVYLPGMGEMDQLTFRVIGRNEHTNEQSNTFYLYIQEGKTYMKK